MTDPFKPVAVPRPPLTPHLLISEPRVWDSVTQVARHSLDTPVTHVSFSPILPYDLSAASGTSVSLIGSRAGNIRRILGRFKDTAHCASYRPDGKLLVAASSNGAQVFDLGSRAILRKFWGHKSTVRSAMFSTDGRRVMTASDDSTVKAWDLATEKCLLTLADATDNVRSQNSSPASQHVWITGSHDRKARLYDLRSSRCLFTLDHGHQIEDVHILPGGARAITVGGLHVRMWDFFSGGKAVCNFTCHSKAVTSVAVCSRLGLFATAGLDGVVKIHDMSTLRSKGRMRFESEILSVDVSADGVKYAVGMANGTVDLRSVKNSRRYVSSVPQSTERREKEFEGYGRGFEKIGQGLKGPKPGTSRYFNRGRRAQPSEDTDYIVKRYRQLKLQDYDRSLKKFAHGEALDLAVKTCNPAVVVSIVEELIVRGTLVGAIAGRDLGSLQPLLKVIRRNIRNPRFSHRLAHLMNVLLDVYGAEFGQNEATDRELKAILTIVQREIRACHDLSALQGTAEAIIATPRDI